MVIGRGKWDSNPEDWFLGPIDNVSVYDYAIGDSDVTQLYQGSPL